MKFLICYLFLALAPSVFAQGASEPGREVYLRLLAFDTATAPKESFAFDPAAASETSGVEAPVKGYLNHEGTTLRLMGDEIVFASSSKPEDAKKPEFQLAKVKLPRTDNAFILVFLPSGKDQYKILPLSNSIKEFPLGSYRVISLSRLPIKLTLEDKTFGFKPGESSLIEDPPVQENNHSAMYCFAEKDGKWQKISSGLWPHPGNKRGVQIFFDNPLTGQTELRGFRDISPRPHEAAAPTTP